MPDEQLSAVNDSELDWITSESMEHYIIELWDSFFLNLEHQESDAIEISTEIDEELKNLEQSAVPKSIANQMRRTSQDLLISWL